MLSTILILGICLSLASVNSFLFTTRTLPSLVVQPNSPPAIFLHSNYISPHTHKMSSDDDAESSPLDTPATNPMYTSTPVPSTPAAVAKDQLTDAQREKIRKVSERIPRNCFQVCYIHPPLIDPLNSFRLAPSSSSLGADG
jgi:hypothetical protein